MGEAEAIKVLIVNEDGRYLTGTATQWEFTDDRNRAKVFDFHRDHVADQIRMVRKAHGTIWIAVRLDPREAYEFCDRCGTRLLSMDAFFDGRQFLCKDCRVLPAQLPAR
jgi:hypothetical protein